MFFADPENDMECYEEHNESGRDGKNRQHILQEPVDKSTKPSNTKASNTDQSPYKRIIHKSTQSTSQQDVSTIYEYIYMKFLQFSTTSVNIALILNPCYFFFEICKLLDDAAAEAKLEATKRKLQQGYQIAENGLYTTV